MAGTDRAKVRFRKLDVLRRPVRGLPSKRWGKVLRPTS